MLSTAGARASRDWVAARRLDVTEMPHWYVEVSLQGRDAAERTSFQLNIYPEEWGFVVRDGARVSSIRITDVPFAHGHDDLRLLARVPELAELPAWLDDLEQERGLDLDRDGLLVRSNLRAAATAVRAWLEAR